MPLEIDGRRYRPFAGAFAEPPKEDKRRVGPRLGTILHPGEDCMVPTLREAIERTELKDGMTVSFHHHFREGDKVLNMVMAEIAAMGFRNMTIAPSSLYSVHEPLIDHIKNGVVTCIEGGSARGKVGRAVSRGLMDRPMVIRSHGGRVRAIERGDLHIDAAFIGAPCADAIGNCNGVKGPSACGPLSYALADAIYSEKTVAVTDYMEETPVIPISISQEFVGTIVKVDNIGDPSKIVSNTLRLTRDTVNLNIAKNAVRVIEASGGVSQRDSLSNRCRRDFPGRDQIPGRTDEKAGHRRQLRDGRHDGEMVKLLEEGHHP